jgi:hypothetical protein
MSSLLYQHALSGKGVGAGLPLRRASRLYNHEPNIIYPTALTLGLDSDSHQYAKGIFLQHPHMQVLRVIEPYIDNKGKTFTRRQYFTVKRGQPLMVTTKRQAQIGVFQADGTVTGRQYLNPEKMAGRGRLVGYSQDGGQTQITVEQFEALPKDQKQYFRAVYTGLEDTNDLIPTGGEDMRVEFEEALYGETNLVRYLQIDADSFYFGAAHKVDGWLSLSTGGFDRVIFFNEVDQDAQVLLPSDGSGDHPFVVTPIGNEVDVRFDNVAAWKDSAVWVDARQTVGIAHTDLEQTTSHLYHQWQSGLNPHSPVRKGTMLLPFIDVVKAKAIIAERAPGVAFDFTDIADGKSGLKVGVALGRGVSNAKKVSVVNRYSLLTAADAGYANLHFNFGAPFVTVTRMPEIHDGIVPDLFGNFTLEGAGFFREGVTVEQTEAVFGKSNDELTSYGLTAEELAQNVDGAVMASAKHRIGKVLNIFDMPAQSMLRYIVNNQFHLRQTADWASGGYERVRSADTAGLEPILADFILMALGGSSYQWSTAKMPKWDKRRQTIANIMEDLVIAGAFGMLEIAVDLTN